jgi:hypothetical protein
VLTFGKQAGSGIVHVATQEPAIAKVVVALDEFDAVALGKAQLVRATGDEVMNNEEDGAGRDIVGVGGLTGGHFGEMIIAGEERALDGGMNYWRGRKSMDVEMVDDNRWWWWWWWWWWWLIKGVTGVDERHGRRW